MGLYSLQLFRAVAESGGFTAAGQQCGLTQSAVTRQVQALEESLGTRLFERTTRRVRLTDAGRALFKDTERLLSDFHETIRSFQQTYASTPPRIRAGIARSVGFAYLPGFFTAFRRKHPQVEIDFSYLEGSDLINRLQQADLDIGVCCHRPRLPDGLEITHQFEDRFVGILPPEVAPESLSRCFQENPLIALAQDSETGKRLAEWSRNFGRAESPAMHTDSFDLTINLVSLGFGVAVVPIRALAIYGRRKPVTRLELEPEFSRTLIVVARRDRYRPEHLNEFIDQILF